MLWWWQFRLAKREDRNLPIVHLNNPDTYDKAVAVLLRYGGDFSGRDPLTLLVSPSQFQTLVAEGLVKPQPPLRKRPHGKKKTKT
jgi:hypothetical protein